jgi:hypothetical protein
MFIQDVAFNDKRPSIGLLRGVRDVSLRVGVADDFHGLCVLVLK